ncbi:unnamed protein product [Closterium sp. NIES-54]
MGACLHGGFLSFFLHIRVRSGRVTAPWQDIRFTTHSITQHSITPHSITQHGITQHSITQHSITQHSILLNPCTAAASPSSFALPNLSTSPSPRLALYPLCRVASHLTAPPLPTLRHWRRYAWTIAHCGRCGMHVGWRFTAVRRSLNPPAFWGVRRAQLTADTTQADADLDA